MTTLTRTRTIPLLVLGLLAAFSAAARGQDNGGTPRLILVPAGGLIGFDSVDSHALIVGAPQAVGQSGNWNFGNQNREAIAEAIAANLGGSVDADQFEWVVDFVYDALNRKTVSQIPALHITSDGVKEISPLLGGRGVEHTSPSLVVPTGPQGKVLVLGRFTVYSQEQSLPDLMAEGYCPYPDEPGYDPWCGDWTFTAPEFPDWTNWDAVLCYVAIGWFSN